MAYIRYPNGERREVKNLGWLLRNWKSVESFTVILTDDFPRSDAMLEGYMRNGDVYVANFSSREMLAGWLDRPVFRGLTVNWLRTEGRDRTFKIGSPEHRRLEEYKDYHR